MDSVGIDSDVSLLVLSYALPNQDSKGLIHHEGYTWAEASVIMGISMRAVRHRLYAALARALDQRRLR